MSDGGQTLWYVYYPNRNTGVVHRWATDGTTVLSDERCQRDEMEDEVGGSEEEAEGLLTEGFHRCSYCWALDGDGHVTNAEALEPDNS
jgi:hypothetical protein